MKTEFASHTSLFYFDRYGWVLVMIVFAAWLASSYTHRRPSRCEGERVLRHDLPARAGHWLNAAGILLLLYSGVRLGFWGIPRSVAGTEAVRAMFNLHFIGAALFLAGAVYWLGNMFLAPKRLVEHSPYKGAIKDAVLHYLHLAGLTKKSGAPTGKYEASERLAFVPLTLLGFVMAVTGLLKLSARAAHLPDGLLSAASAIHDYGTALMAVLLLFHVTLAALVPWAWPLMRSMIDGYVPLDFVKKTHAAWYRELVDEGLCPAEKKESA